MEVHWIAEMLRGGRTARQLLCRVTISEYVSVRNKPVNLLIFQSYSVTMSQSSLPWLIRKLVPVVGFSGYLCNQNQNMWQYLSGWDSRQESWQSLLYKRKTFGKTFIVVTWEADYVDIFGCICPNIQERDGLRKELAGLQTEIKGNRIQKFRSLQKWESPMPLDPK